MKPTPSTLETMTPKTQDLVARLVLPYLMGERSHVPAYVEMLAEQEDYMEAIDFIKDLMAGR